MGTTILQASVGAGKTEEALRRLTAVLNQPDKPLARAWVLLATRRQEVAFRHRIAELDDGHSVYFNAEFFNIYDLNTRVLKLGGVPVRRISESARVGLLRVVIQRLLLERQLRVFGRIALHPGFLSIIADLIYELKQNLVYPEQFVRMATANRNPKDLELATIYARYQSLLQRFQLVDREGEAWLARDTLIQNQHIVTHVDLLLVDGFDQFTPVQADIIAALSRQIEQVDVTLTGVRGREQLIGARFEGALRRLEQSHQQLAVDFSVEQLPDVYDRHNDLNVLTHTIGSYDVAPVTPQDDPTCIRLIEAPEPADEVSAVLRSVKRLLLDGVQPENILIALRDWPTYYHEFDVYGRLYGVPLLKHYNQPIREIPALSVFMQALSLAGDGVRGFRRRDVLDVLRSPYIAHGSPNEPSDQWGMSVEDIDLLDRISQQHFVISGRSSWFDAILQAETSPIEDDEDAERLTITAEQSARLSIGLEDFFDAVGLPARATRSEFVTHIDRLIGPDPLYDVDEDAVESPFDAVSLNLLANIRAAGDDDTQRPLIARDIAAIRAFKDILRGYVTTEELLQSSLGITPEIITWGAFSVELAAAVRTTIAETRTPNRSGRVLITSATEARGLPHDHVFILGLSEGVFPAKLSEDALYTDSERTQLRADYQQLTGDEGAIFLQKQSERANDEGIFYELISLSRRSLTLSRPTVRDGKPWNPSYLWRWTADVFTGLTMTRYRVGEVVPPVEVASVDEALRAGVMMTTDAESLRAWLATQPDTAAAWTRIIAGAQLEMGRLSQQPFDRYSGRIDQPDLQATIADRLNERHRWSASQLKEFGDCGYRFFARRLLKLEPVTPVSAGLDARQLGSVNHEILERVYHEVMIEKLIIAPDTQAEALDIFAEIADEVLATAPEKHRFKPSAMWESEKHLIKQRLSGLISADFSAQSPFSGFHGERRLWAVEQRIDETVFINEAIGALKIVGFIDRIDQVGDGLVIVDYKTGGTKIKESDLAEGRNFQMLIYKLGLEAALQSQGRDGQDVVGGFFWHIRTGEISDVMRFDSDAHDETFTSALGHIARYVRNGRAGRFLVHPAELSDNGRCSKFCDYYQLCRVAVTHRNKHSG